MNILSCVCVVVVDVVVNEMSFLIVVIFKMYNYSMEYSLFASMFIHHFVVFLI